MSTNISIWPQKATDLNMWEDHLISNFRKHPVFQHLRSQTQTSQESFHRLLIQRRFFSLAFTTVADIVQNGLKHENGKIAMRALIRAEYPTRGKSHRELLMEDLNALKIPLKDILQADPTDQTANCLKQTYQMLKPNEDTAAQYEVKLLSFMRFWGEVLVAVEYDEFSPRLLSEGLTNSVFYADHFEHDHSSRKFGDPKLKSSIQHSDKLAAALEDIFRLTDETGLVNYCAKIENDATGIKLAFYDQFIGS